MVILKGLVLILFKKMVAEIRILRLKSYGVSLILMLLLFTYFCRKLVLDRKIYIYVKEESVEISILDEKKENLTNFLVNSEYCMIPTAPIFGDDVMKYYNPPNYRNCSKNELLSFISKRNGTVELVIRKEIVHLYTQNNITCCFSYVRRGYNESDPDNVISYTNCTHFEGKVTLNETTVLVICKDNQTDIYKNTHSFTRIEDVIHKISGVRSDLTDRPVKILLIGIDSMSRLNLRRMMPLAHKYLERNDWIEYQGYNKIDDNTFPNLMAIFTGRNYTHAYKDCHGTEVGNLDKCNFLWYDFKKSGFATAFVEDLTKISTFNYYRKGFKEPPTHFYFRPYMLASENISDSTYCTGPETTGERILNLIRDYTAELKDYPTFGLFWMNSFSHDDINQPAMMDEVFANFFNDLHENDVFNDSVVIFFSDHGMRFGDFRYTKTGWYEERLPFLHFWIPDWFRHKYPEKYENLKSNYNKLTTPYDLYMTLQDLLKVHDNNYAILKSSACNNCHSLFEPISIKRTCNDVAIEQHYCTCTNYETIDKNNSLVLNTANFMLNELNSMILKSKYGSLCAKYELMDILSASSTSMIHSDNLQIFHTFLLLEIQTIPEAVFEGTFNITQVNNNTLYNLNSNISRLDYYALHSKCVDDSYMKKYCYCR